MHGKSLFEKHLFTKGSVKIGELLSDTGKFLESPKVLEANLSPIQYFKLSRNCRCHTKRMEANYERITYATSEIYKQLSRIRFLLFFLFASYSEECFTQI